jgi:Mor family transcriptional regulator
MKAKNYDGRSVVADMIEGCGKVVDRDVVAKAIREVCRYFGGQLVYIPVHKTSGKTTEELHGILRDAAGDPDAGLMLGKLMALYGGQQIYIPMEKSAFRDTVAREIYECYTGNHDSIGDICRRYNISFNTLYKFYHLGRDNKAQGVFDFGEE